MKVWKGAKVLLLHTKKFKYYLATLNYLLAFLFGLSNVAAMINHDKVIA